MAKLNWPLSKISTVIGLIVLAIASWWALRFFPDQGRPVIDPLPQQADYVIEDFRATVMDKQGKKKYILKAKRLQHFPHKQQALLDEPHLIQYDADANEIHTRARQGVLLDDRKHLNMSGNVTITRGSEHSSAADTMTTEKLEILLE